MSNGVLVGYTDNEGNNFPGNFQYDGAVGPIGPTGPQGPQGEQGIQGPKPVKGDDYFTQDDIDSMVEIVEAYVDDEYAAAFTKLDDIEEGAEVNIIETVKVNSNALTPDENRAVNITVPVDTGDLTNNAGYIKKDVNNLENYTTTDNLNIALASKAELDSNGKVPSSQLPSYVDDVVEYNTYSAFPETGETGKIYIALDTNKTYRWSGSAYVEISESLALGETSSTAYRGDRGKIAYDHANDANRLTTAKSTGLYKISTTSEGHVAGVTAVEKSDIINLGINEIQKITQASVNPKNFDEGIYEITGLTEFESGSQNVSWGQAQNALLVVHAADSTSYKSWVLQAGQVIYIGSCHTTNQYWGSLYKVISGLNVNNNLTTTTGGYVLDARQGKALNDAKQDKLTAGDNIDITNNVIKTVGETIKEATITDNKVYLENLSQGIYAIPTGVDVYKLGSRKLTLTAPAHLLVRGDENKKYYWMWFGYGENAYQNIYTVVLSKTGDVWNAYSQEKTYQTDRIIDLNSVVHNLTTEDSTKVLDATQGKILNETKENLSNKKTAITSDLTNDDYVGGKAIYDRFSGVDERIKTIEEVMPIQTLTWEDVRRLVDDGDASRFFSIGDELAEDWKTKLNGTETTYAKVPMYVSHLQDNVTVQEDNEDVSVKGMYMEWKYTLPFDTPFCAPQCLQCFDGTDGVPDGLPAGNYAIKCPSLPNWADARTAYQGKYLCFTLANAIPSGGILTGSGWGNNTTWKMLTKSSHLNNATTIETVDITVETSLPTGYTFLGDTWGEDVGYGKLNWPECIPYGDNTWRDSDLRQFLNSNAEAGSWWTKKTRYNIQPAMATTRAGFLYGYSDDFISKLRTVKVAQNTNTRKENEGIVYTYDKIFIVSRTQANTNTENEITDDTIWDFYKALAVGQSNLDDSGRFKAGQTYAILKRYSLEAKTTARVYWHRSDHRSHGNNVYNCYTSGYLSYYGANHSYRCLPACVI